MITPCPKRDSPSKLIRRNYVDSSDEEKGKHEQSAIDKSKQLAYF